MFVKTTNVAYSLQLMKARRTGLVYILAFINGTFSTNRLYRAAGVLSILCKAGGKSNTTDDEKNIL